MRVVTRPDFDGVVCAILLMDALNITPPVHWTQPSDMQRGQVVIRAGDVIANLPYHENCSLWFDHHYSNQPDKPIPGAFKLAPSAAGIVYDTYRDRLKRDYRELVHQTDRIDSADLTLDEILHPEKYPFVLLSMTISNDPKEKDYWEHLIALMRRHPMDQVMNDQQVRRRCGEVVAANVTYEKALKANTTLVDHVSITDFRDLDPVPNGNRFLIYSLFPECTVNVKIVHDGNDITSIKVGHSILNRGCQVNVGKMLAGFEGGGHRGAGACRFARSRADDYLSRIVSILKANQPV
ncbi:exopolyphosphatase [Desulfosarcina ovata]|uniref:Exopolyphosphatase n=1 Tax=Desulfosarcina ovata subsp. ovata TaxID=2752305 RepID=A0A5K8ADG8_9BACT|nr:exopolyphosphatase [Desulfosarcina ovata]BBO90743.1 exopolyphosphatase [Desulfosarcina ovata subsp. ovata]